MNKKIKEKWVRALRSGKYTQGDGQLKKEYSYEPEVTHCCLGVLCEITGNAKNRDMYESFPKVNENGDAEEFMGIPGPVQEELARMNDSGECDFNKIADYIEEKL